jgi:hypothetical protein
MPMILLDGVDFLMDEGEDTTDKKHIMFWLFISDLYQAAHAGGVVVFWESLTSCWPNSLPY